MKSYVIPILKGIITGILDANRESSKFIIKCSKCECLGELEYGFFKESGDIEVDNAGENIISIRCSKCGNEILSSEY
ncbi:hypothetical protein [Bacillus sp. T33-2]|uniref:hypothetical protein n=1 Tax=Bacillus sp. T33-2 TaxID=2054168 RepID=UPI000C771B25|nr:hypothetical protein [Bacillus sp. T33-2]PLR99042.1 hypothetical protein CVD19_02960 [Bacillus sp. T33-2]